MQLVLKNSSKYLLSILTGKFAVRIDKTELLILTTTYIQRSILSFRAKTLFYINHLMSFISSSLVFHDSAREDETVSIKKLGKLVLCPLED